MTWAEETGQRGFGILAVEHGVTLHVGGHGPSYVPAGSAYLPAGSGARVIQKTIDDCKRKYWPESDKVIRMACPADRKCKCGGKIVDARQVTYTPEGKEWLVIAGFANEPKGSTAKFYCEDCRLVYHTKV